MALFRKGILRANCLAFPKRKRLAHWRGFHAAIQSGTFQLSGKPTIAKGLHKNESKKLYIQMSFAIIIDQNGSVKGSVAIARDATDLIAKKT